MLLENELNMKTIERRKKSTNIHILEDEKDFFSLIDRRMEEQGYQCLTSIKQLRKTDTLVLFR